MKLKNRSAEIFPQKFFENSVNEWLSTKDVAKLLSTTPNAVRIMICRGQLEASRFRSRLRIRKKDCMMLLKKRGA